MHAHTFRPRPVDRQLSRWPRERHHHCRTPPLSTSLARQTDKQACAPDRGGAAMREAGSHFCFIGFVSAPNWEGSADREISRGGG
jgi:hypothetical protein